MINIRARNKLGNSFGFLLHDFKSKTCMQYVYEYNWAVKVKRPIQQELYTVIDP